MKRFLATAVAVFTFLVLVAGAWAHAQMRPNVVQAKEDQLFTLIVPTEKENATTIRVELTLPEGFEVDSFVPSRDWLRIAGGGHVTWSGGHVLSGEAAIFQFVGSTEASTKYTFDVRQTYSDGSVVDWSGAEDSDTPAPVVEAKSSLSSGGGTSTVTWIALALGGLGALLGLVALAGRGRELA